MEEDMIDTNEIVANINDLKRIRWIITDDNNLPFPCTPPFSYTRNTYIDSGISNNDFTVSGYYQSGTTSGTTTITSGTTTDENEYPKSTQYCVLLKRLLKCTYYDKAAKYCAKFNYVRISNETDVFDNNVFVDLNDKTMWYAFDSPLLLDDFYKTMVSNDICKDKYVGYEIDSLPSLDLVCLHSLRSTFVDWWCQ